MNIVFTLCSNNYLSKAITLGNSLLQHNPDYIFKIGLVDRKNKQIDYTSISFEIIEVESIGIIAFEEMFKRYSITELNTAVKPYFFKYFFDAPVKASKCIYLDPDILVYGSFKELEVALEKNEIVITPHFTTPIEDNKFQAENNFLNSGIYNLGFLAVRRGTESQKFLSWWADRLTTKAFIDFSNGMFTDQLWINFVPLFFKSVYVLNHPGYNMAYWNLHERKLTNNRKIRMNGNESELRFYHFSGYDPMCPGIISKYQDRFSFNERKDVEPLFSEYCQELFQNGYSEYICIKSYFTEEKKKLDLEKLKEYKRSIPLHKRVLRGMILRFINWFRVDVRYYTSS